MKLLKFVIRQMFPLLFSYIFMGIAVGMLYNEAGFSSIYVLLSSFFIYAGSMQIVMISLMKSGTSLLLIGIMTFFINARHIFYGFTFIDEFRKIGKKKNSFWKYPYMALTITDETYSVLYSMECPSDINKEKAEFYLLFLCHMLWMASTTLGALVGDFLPFSTEGVEFSAIAFFVTVVINQWMKFNSKIPVVTGFLSSILFYFILGPDNFILPALSFSLIVILIMKHRIIVTNGGEAL